MASGSLLVSSLAGRRLALVLGLALGAVGCGAAGGESVVAPKVAATTPCPAMQAPTVAASMCGEGTMLLDGRCVAATPVSAQPVDAASPVSVMADPKKAAPLVALDEASDGAEATRAGGTVAEASASSAATTSAPTAQMGQIDFFLLSDATNTDVYLDGHYSGEVPVKTFLLSPGDHIVEFRPVGIPGCRITLRDTQVGQSITIRATLIHPTEAGCAVVARRPELGKLADL